MAQFFGLVLLLGISISVYAQTEDRPGGFPGWPPPFDREEMLKRFDSDGDGELNDEERRTMREAMLSQPGGFPGGPPRFDREEMLKRFDADGDGQLSEEERKAMREAMPRFGPPFGMFSGREELVEQFDTDGDGKLNDEERKAARKYLQDKGGDWPAPPRPERKRR